MQIRFTDEQELEIKKLVEQGYTLSQISKITDNGWGNNSYLHKVAQYHRNQYKKSINHNRIMELTYQCKMNYQLIRELREKIKKKSELIKKYRARISLLKEEIEVRTDDEIKLRKEVSELKKLVNEYKPKGTPGRKPQVIQQKKVDDAVATGYVYVVVPLENRIGGCYTTEESAKDKADYDTKALRRSFTYTKCYLRKGDN